MATVRSRAAVAGNPSDGFGGAVCSVIVPFLAATATVVKANGGDQFDLVAATTRRFSASVAPVGDVGVAIDTTIPRSVGLAGSSAIVIATLRALAQHTGKELPASALAQLAHQVEREDLGIAGGWQDQIIQSHGVSGLMEFSPRPRLEPIDFSAHDPIPLYLAWSADAAESSGESHSALRESRTDTDREMVTLAGYARDAASAFRSRDVHALKSAIDATFDTRRQLMDIAPPHLAMVETARGLGAAANFAGSGGTILGVLPKNGDEFLRGLTEAGYEARCWIAE